MKDEGEPCRRQQPGRNLRPRVRAWRRTLRDPASAVVDAVLGESLTYLDAAALTDLFHVVRGLAEDRIEGDIIEAGCALGGSAIVIARAKAKEQAFAVYDVFGMIPPPSVHDGGDVRARYEVIRRGESEGLGGNPYYGYEKDLYEVVLGNMARHGVVPEEMNISLVRGLFQDTLDPKAPVALAHLDGDWYESIQTCLQRIAPYLLQGGRFIVDDYDTWSGARRAVDEYFVDKQDLYLFHRQQRLHIIRR